MKPYFTTPAPDFRFHCVTVTFKCLNCLPDQLELSILPNESNVPVSSSSVNDRVVTQGPEPPALPPFGLVLGIVGFFVCWVKDLFRQVATTQRKVTRNPKATFELAESGHFEMPAVLDWC